MNIRSLESSIETFKLQEESLNNNFLEVIQKLDSFIDRQIELLQKERQNVKDKLRKSFSTQKDDIRSQKESFQSFRDCLKQSVQYIEKNLSEGSEVKILSAKNQMIQQLTEINSATADLRPRGKVTYDLEADPPVDEKTVCEIAKIREYDEEYKLTIVPDVPEFLAKVLTQDLEKEALKSSRQFLSLFNIRPKRKNTRDSPDNIVEVKIKLPDSDDVHSPDINSREDGSFSFSYLPASSGDYKIEVIINGRHLHGSPFTWQVRSRLGKLH